MKAIGTLLLVTVLLLPSVLIAQTYQRKVLNVPKVDPAAITIDGLMNETEWSSAASANLVTASGFEMFMFAYGREGLLEPEYDELFAKVLWAKETLYVFIRIDEFVNDSTDLYWDGQWKGDQLFVGLSNRLGRDLQGWYDGNVYASPGGPYHFLIMADSVTLNASKQTYIPDQYKRFPEDTVRVFHASDIARWATTINTTTGVWTIEMAVYHPNANAGARIGFNIGGSTGSTANDTATGDAYAYWTWQPSVVDSPFVQPQGVPVPGWGTDPGYYNLATSVTWALLNLVPGPEDYMRKVVQVPVVDGAAITIDGQMNESAWSEAGSANVVTGSGFEMFMFPYGREGLLEPEYDELYARLLWSKETLYAFIRIDEFVNDSTDLYWNGQWIGDQLFVGLSNRLAVDLKGWYDGNVYASPDGPYHFLILADSVSLNASKATYVPTEYRRFPTDTVRVFHASDIAQWAATINTTTGVWTIEMAVHHPNVNLGSRLGFNMGGSTGSTANDTASGDAYAYWTWQPSVVDSPFVQPAGVPVPGWGTDPGYYNLATSVAWALLEFVTTVGTTGVERDPAAGIPAQFELSQNYPNPFNPETVIEFRIPQQSRVLLEVYNILGQRVATLVDGVQQAGVYRVGWNAARLGTGVYFSRLTTESGIVLTKKMLLVK